MENNLIGMIYDDGDVLSLADKACREKWYSIIKTEGLEPAEKYLINQNPKYKKLIVISLVENNYVLIPWSDNSTEYKNAKQAVKLTYRKRGFSGVDMEHMYVFRGLEVKIAAKELEEYNVYLTVTRYLLGNIEKIYSSL